MSFRLAPAVLALVLLGACQGTMPKSAETTCEEAGSARGSEAFEACVTEQRRIAEERRKVLYSRVYRGPKGR